VKSSLALIGLFSAAATAASLDIVTVGAPAIHCKYDTDCAITGTDTSDHFIIGPSAGDAFLQSRSWPPGESGTPAEGLYGYKYRLDLRQLAGLTAMPCINRFSIDFGPVSPLDYDDDGNPDDVFVVTSGGLGSVAPSSAEKVGDRITFTFSPPVCAGNSPGNGESSYFFGLTSAEPPRAVVAQIADTLGDSLELEARAPEVRPRFAAWPQGLFVLFAIVLLAAGGVWLARRKTSKAS
jgi:hypothetical protein